MLLAAVLTSIVLAQAAPWSPPPPRRGFQGVLALQRAGATGDVIDGLAHRDVLPSAMEVEAQLGWKLADRLFAGLYLAGGVSRPGPDTRSVCEEEDLRCTGATRRAGLLARLDLRPAGAWNPWIAAGAGIERHDVKRAVRLPGSSSPDAPTVVHRMELRMRGVEPLRLLAGVDFRSTRVLGIGVHAGVSFGRYRELSSDVPPSPTTVRPGEADLADGARASHAWLTLGVHGVLFP